MMIIDGSDELIGWNTLKLFNAIYQGKTLGYVYSNFYDYSEGQKVTDGQISQHTED